MSCWIKDTRAPLFCLRLLKSRLLASAKVVLDKRPYKISSKAMHRVCCFYWCQHVISWMADIWLELVSLVSCILPPLPRFRAVTCYRPLCLQTRHMWRWLTSVKLMFTGLTNFFNNQDRRYTSVTEIARNVQMSTNDNSILLANLHSFTRDFHTFCYTDGLFKKQSMLVNLFSAEKIFFQRFWFSFLRESLFPRRIPGSDVCIMRVQKKMAAWRAKCRKMPESDICVCRKAKVVESHIVYMLK